MSPRLSPSTIATCAAALIVSACASSGASSSPAGAAPAASGTPSYGYMIPGGQVASALGIRATDTLPELPARSNLATTLANAISAEVSTGNWNDRCTRRFGGPQVYAVIFHRTCDAAAGPEAEPQVVVGFSADGRALGRVRWSGPNTVTRLVPARRF